MSPAPEPIAHGADADPIEATLREVVTTLALLDRAPCSPGELAAAEWLHERMRTIPGVEPALETEPSWGTFPPTATGLGLAGALAALLGLRGHRLSSALLALATFLGILDEAHNGPRVLRRLVRRRRATVNLIARAGDPRAPTTLVVLAHHDAPQTGILFDQTLQRALHARAPHLLERFKSPLPQWWFGLAGPLATLLGALRSRAGDGGGRGGDIAGGLHPVRLGVRGGLGRRGGDSAGGHHRGRRGARAGLVLGLLGAALVADVWRSPTVPGANDNLSGVASLVALAELLRDRPIPGLRVLLVSCGAEETLQDGIRAFLASHRHELDPATTRFVNLDTVGSPHLVLLEAEGPVRMEHYSGPWLRDLFAERALALSIPLRRGYRARASTDSIIPSRASYPTATLVSMTDWLAPANYHLPTDTPARLDYSSVAHATRLVYEVARSLASIVSMRSV